MNPVAVLYHRESAGWWADSPDVPGWSATASTLDELRSLVEDGVRFALESDDVSVIHMLAPGVTPPGLHFDFVGNRVLVVPGPAGLAEGVVPPLQFAATG